MLKELLESTECKKGITRLSNYNEKIFKEMKKSIIKKESSYPYGGEIVAKVTDNLLKLIKEEYNPDTKIKVGDCVKMDNGWTS
jgi:hypothetical protein